MTALGRSESRIYPLLFALLFLPYAYFDHNDAWNQISRLAALHAVVIRHTIVIDDYQVYTGDKAFINGHYYSEKAPGIAFLALPAFSLTVAAQRMLGIDPDSLGCHPASSFNNARVHSESCNPHCPRFK